MMMVMMMMMVMIANPEMQPCSKPCTRLNAFILVSSSEGTEAQRGEVTCSKSHSISNP